MSQKADPSVLSRTSGILVSYLWLMRRQTRLAELNHGDFKNNDLNEVIFGKNI